MTSSLILEPGESAGDDVFASGVSFREEIRCVKLFSSCSPGTNVRFQIIAGLISILTNQFSVIAGSNGYEGVG